MAVPMGFFQPEFLDFCFKRKFRWKLLIPDVSADGVNALPNFRGARPGWTFREMNGEHLNETIFFPSKPEWKEIQLVLYDIAKPNENPVFSWLKRAYNPKGCSAWYPCLDSPSFKAIAVLELYDGCGGVIEQWIIEHAWPHIADFGELEMSNSEVVMVDVTLRYDRAYIICPPTPTPLGFATISPNACSQISCTSFINFESVEAPDFTAVW